MSQQGTFREGMSYKSPEKRMINHISSQDHSSFPCLIRIPISFYLVQTQALIDTGAAASLISLDLVTQLPCKKLVELDSQVLPSFKTVSGEIVKAKGTYHIKITLSNKDSFIHKFHVIKHIDEGCILGIDFLIQNNILINAKERSITYKKGNQQKTLSFPIIPLNSIIQTGQTYHLPNVPSEHLKEVEQLLLKNDHIFANKMSELGMATACKHTINTGDTQPIKMQGRRTPHSLRIIVKTQIEEMEKHNIIRESTSPYAAPVVMVPKKGGEMRFCVDYRLLNKATIKDRYPLPRIDDTIDALYGAQYFSTLDLFSGYWQIEIEEADKYKTAFVCEFGQYEFNRMPFGLTNAPATFQRLMNKILKPVLYQSALVYLDDIIVFSKTIIEHIKALQTIFSLLAEAGLKLKMKKCEFFKNKINYLGHIVSNKGVAPDDRKVKSIIEYPEPTNQKELLSFLGLASYYRKFIRAFAEKAHPLTSLTRKNSMWNWGDLERDAFNCIKDCLMTKPILSYPDFTRDFIIHTDASGFGIGAVLAQMQSLPHSVDLERSDDQEVVIAYASKHLNDRESKWSTTEKEAYAIIHAIDVFKPYLYGRKFTVYTDHRPLEWLMSKTEPSGRLSRWALKIQEYNIAIGYRAGKNNQNADSLSRIPKPVIATMSLKIQDDWITEQRKDEYCRNSYDLMKKEQDESFELNNKLLINKEGKILVPKTKIEEILRLNHDHILAGHLGIAKTTARIKRQYVWPNMINDIKKHVTSCIQCAKRKAIGSSKAPLQPIAPAERVWERIAMDVVGPLPETIKNNKYILVLSDYATRFAITIAMEDQKARTVAKHLVEKIITKYGAPEIILTDQGTNFLSKLIKEICELFKIKQIRTTSYHPQTDGLVERLNRTICDMLACYVNEQPDKWDEFLDFVTLAYNSSEQATLKNCPFFLFYGRQPVLPSDIIIRREFFDDEETY